MMENYFAGIPTAPDVRKLCDTFNARIKDREIIGYPEVVEALKTPKGSKRFQTVTNRWRKLLEDDEGIIIGCERGIGFKMLDNFEKVDLSSAKIKQAIKSTTRSVVVAGHIDRKQLNGEDLKRLDHQELTAAAILGAAKSATQNIVPDMKPTKQIKE
jgi:hypothetical protein